MKITVTKLDIKKGVRASAVSCPIALAIKRQTKKRKKIYVAWDTLYYFEKEIPLPSHAIQFIRDFDKFHIVEPFSFTIKLRN